MGLVAMIARDDIYLFQKAMTNAAPLCILLLALLTITSGNTVTIPAGGGAMRVTCNWFTRQTLIPISGRGRDRHLSCAIRYAH